MSEITPEQVYAIIIRYCDQSKPFDLLKSLKKATDMSDLMYDQIYNVLCEIRLYKNDNVHGGIKFNINTPRLPKIIYKLAGIYYLYYRSQDHVSYDELANEMIEEENIEIESKIKLGEIDMDEKSQIELIRSIKLRLNDILNESVSKETRKKDEHFVKTEKQSARILDHGDMSNISSKHRDEVEDLYDRYRQATMMINKLVAQRNEIEAEIYDRRQELKRRTTFADISIITEAVLDDPSRNLIRYLRGMQFNQAFKDVRYLQSRMQQNSVKFFNNQRFIHAINKSISEMTQLGRIAPLFESLRMGNMSDYENELLKTTDDMSYIAKSNKSAMLIENRDRHGNLVA